MVIAIIGESCTGKSTLADRLKEDFNATVYTGKDYLRMAKSPTEAESVFKNMLAQAAHGKNIIYVIAEAAHLRLLPDGCFKILVTAELEIIKERFAKRTGGRLPPPVAAMLEKNHGVFDGIENNFHYGQNGDYDKLKEAIGGFYEN